MPLDSTHPQFDSNITDWTTQRDLYGGETLVKSKEQQYLPATPGMLIDGIKKGEIGYAVYEGYIKRAVFPDYVKDGVDTLVGMLHYKPPVIELPEQLEDMREDATLTGETLEDLLRRVNYEQLLTGRVGLLADLPSAPVGTPALDKGADNTQLLPYIETYVAESVRNWDEAVNAEGYRALNLVVLDESGYRRTNNFDWELEKRYRVLQLGNLDANEPEGTAVYLAGTFNDKNNASIEYNASNMVSPTYRGTELQEIPFVFVNTRDLLSTPDVAPLLGLGRLSLAIYRGEADYRQALFMQGQDTLVVMGGTRNPDGTTGEDDAIRTGAGSRIDVDQGGDAKFIGVSSLGLSEMRSAIENDRKRAEARAGQLINAKSAVESGEALKTRLTAQTATLNQIALSGAQGLENILRVCATWVGADPDKVKVTPNMEFGEMVLNPADLTALMQARMNGAPLSKKSIHDLMASKRLTSLDYEDELELIAQEDEEALKQTAAKVKLLAEATGGQRPGGREPVDKNAPPANKPPADE